jgi:Asp-tRNA(Asn)/Glu-tRNA(Gln) amidotransferase A subunit family amidase
VVAITLRRLFPVLLSLQLGTAAAAGLEDASIRELQILMASGEISAVTLTEFYLSRIEALDRGENGLHAIISINPQALETARQLDLQRQETATPGPLHGIPVLIKDNIETVDQMPTTQGSLLLRHYYAKEDAYLVQKLRDAGAIILGKANLSEWANMRSSHSVGGWSALGGLTLNPYDLTRNACGSSAGSAVGVAAGFAAAAIGTETDGSIVCPAAVTGVVGFKATLGLVSRRGILPLAHSQDHAGTLTRTVEDAALMLQVLAGFDAGDPLAIQGEPDYERYLNADGLKGKTLGVVRNLMGRFPKSDAVFETQLDVLRQLGATIAEPCSIDNYEAMKKAEAIVLDYEFKADTNEFLGRAGVPGLRTLADLIDANKDFADQEMRWFGQDIFERADRVGSLESEEYLQALTDSKRLAGREGIDAALKSCKADILIAPTARPAWKTDLINGSSSGGTSASAAAVAGYPHIAIPMGFVEGLPVSISFIGSRLGEPALLQAAFSYEQATLHRRAPRL